MTQELPEEDWEVTPDGLFIATRGFLVRRGYCCANRCRNCPYINWNENPAWQPAPVEAIRKTCVPSRSLAGARWQLDLHERALRTANQQECVHHRAMIEHYKRLLECWRQRA
jgi:hypothetical protein